MIVVGIAGRKRHGKDTLADFAIKRLESGGFTTAKRHFADPLKEEVIRIVAEHTGEDYNQLLQDAYTEEGKERFRLGWQWWGTDIWRDVDSEHWIKCMQAQLVTDAAAGVDVVFISDMRFPNEADLVKELSGYNVRILRPGMDDGDGHASEHALDNYQGWDSQILNDSDLDALEHKAIIMLGKIAWAHTSSGKRV
jgi:hypothetical protein